MTAKKTLTVKNVALPVSEELKVKARVRAGRRIPRGGVKLVIEFAGLPIRR